MGNLSSTNISWVISLFGLVLSLSRITTCTQYSQASRSKFIVIIMGIYMSSSIYYYTKGERSDDDE